MLTVSHEFELCQKRWFKYLQAFKKKYLGDIQECDPAEFSEAEKMEGLQQRFLGELPEDFLFEEEHKVQEFNDGGNWSIDTIGEHHDFNVHQESCEGISISLMDCQTGDSIFQYISQVDHLSDDQAFSVSLSILNEKVMDSEKDFLDCKKMDSLLQEIKKQYPLCQI